MTIGKPDWSEQEQSLSYLNSNDLAELAVRLGSPIRYYRSGTIIFYTGFETNDDFVVLSSPGASTSMQIVSTWALQGAKSVESITLSGFSGNTLFKNLGYISTNYLALSCGVALEDLVGILDFYISVYNDNGLVEFVLRFNETADEISVIDETLSFIKLANMIKYGSADDKLWANFKLWCNLTDKKYLKLDVSGDEYDISTISAYQPATPEFGHVIIKMVHRAPSTGTSTIYVDNLAVTVNDPS